MTKIEFRDVNFWYGDKQILERINLKIKPYKITALIGPSGCGKSTLLRCVNRMNDLIANARIEGEVLYDGEDTYHVERDVVELRKRIGMVFQKPNPFPMSIFDNVAYGVKVQTNKTKEEIEKIVEESLKKADLWDEVKERLNSSAFG